MVLLRALVCFRVLTYSVTVQDKVKVRLAVTSGIGLRRLPLDTINLQEKEFCEKHVINTQIYGDEPEASNIQYHRFVNECRISNVSDHHRHILLSAFLPLLHPNFSFQSTGNDSVSRPDGVNNNKHQISAI